MQNLYDDADFFERYKELRERPRSLNECIEQPAMKRLIAVRIFGASVLDLGCGSGSLSRFALEQGAERVVALDSSARMLRDAETLLPGGRAEFVPLAMEDYEYPAGEFDIVIASLAIHYVADFQSLAKAIARALRPNGLFAFSVEHPMCTALGLNEWVLDGDGSPLHFPVDRYFEEGLREFVWLDQTVRRYHRTVESYVSGLLAAGLVVSALEEPGPANELVALHPNLQVQTRRPPFLILAATRP